MRRTFVVTLAGLVALVPIPSASAHEPYDGPKHELALIFPDDAGGASGSSNASGDPHWELAISEEEAGSENSSVEFGYYWGPGACYWPYAICLAEPAVVAGNNIDEPFPLALDSTILGKVHIAWAYEGSGPQICCETDYAAIVYVDLEIGDALFSNGGIVLERRVGDEVFDVELNYHCEEDSCSPPDLGQASSEDVRLVITLAPVYNQGSPSTLFGSSLKVKFDTAGGTSVTLTEFVPPVPPAPIAEPVETTGAQPVEAEPVAPEPMQVSDPEAVYVPAPILPLLLVAIAMGLGFVRRRA